MGEFIVTARKWRPTRFDDVVGQAHITTTLRNAIASNRIAHAYLFSGPRGVGKTTTARLFAKAVNCAQPDQQNPDNTCESCVEITEGRSFDVLEIDGASNRGVEEIRNIRDSVRYAPSKGKYKVYIIDEVHMLTKEAFNALLKTLEEPPPHVLFILATTEIFKLPATILSRCQRFDFRRIATDEIAGNLKQIADAEGIAADAGALSMIARKGDGSLRDAQSFFDQVVALCGRDLSVQTMVRALNMVDVEMFFRVTDLIASGDVTGGLTLVDEVMRNGHDLKEFVSGLNEHLRNLLVVASSSRVDLLDTTDVYRARYREMAPKFSVPDLLRLIRLAGATEASLRWTTQPRFKLEADIVQMITAPRAQDVGELLQRLDELKKKGTELHSTAAGHEVPDVRSPAAPVPAASAPQHRAPAPTPSQPQPPPLPGAPPGAPPRARRPVAAASAPSAVAGVPTGLKPIIAEKELAARWPEFLDAVRTTKISLWSAMEKAGLKSVEGQTVRLTVPDDFQAKALQRNAEILSEIFAKIFSVKPRIVTEIGSAAPLAGELPDDEPAGPVREDHPMIELIRKELGAEPL
jgi:DNA polymerase III subunit gamma/tau